MDFREFINLSDLEETLAEVATKNAYLDPMTGKKWRHANMVDQLRHILNDERRKGSKSNNLWVTYSNVPKLGVNPSSNYNSSPIGIYAYPLSYVIEKQPSRVPYASDRNYLVVFKVIDRKNIMRINPKPENFTKHNALKKHRMNLPDGDILKWFENKEKFIEKYASGVLKNTPDEIKPYTWQVIKKTYEKFIDDLKLMIQSAGISYKGQGNIVSNASSYIKNARVEDAVLPILRSTRLTYFNKIYDFFKRIDLEGDLQETRTAHNKYDVNWESGNLIVKYSSSYVSGKYNTLLRKIGYSNLPQDKKRQTLDKAMEGWSNKRLINTFPQDPVFQTPEGKKLPEYLRKQKELGQNLNLTVIRDLAKNLYYKLIRMADAYAKQYKAKAQNIKIPFKAKLMDIAAKNGIDFNRALRTFDADEFNSGQKIVYEITRRLADEKFPGDSGKMEMLWSHLLMQLGFKGMTDAFGTSSIHAGEPAQAVFFDVSNLEFITYIENHPLADPRGNVGRPKGTDWSDEKKRHEIDYRAKQQRTHSWSPIDSVSMKNRDRREITLAALNMKISDFKDRIRSFDPSAAAYLKKLLLTYNNFIKTLKTPTKEINKRLMNLNLTCQNLAQVIEYCLGQIGAADQPDQQVFQTGVILKQIMPILNDILVSQKFISSPK